MCYWSEKNIQFRRQSSRKSHREEHDAYMDAWKSGVLVSQTGDKEHSKDNRIDEWTWINLIEREKERDKESERYEEKNAQEKT